MPAGHESDRWKDRRVLAAIVGVTIAIFPVACSIGSVIVVQRFITVPTSVLGFALWWLGTIGFCTLVFLSTERLARKVLPLAVLLKMGMAFPGRAPRRLAVARRAGSVRDLHRKVEEARTKGLADEPTVAAEKIVTLAATLSAHDRTTRGHAERVRALTDMVAEELRLPQAHRDKLRWSSLLHDIGKLTVHPDVLNKPGELDAREWEIIRRHPLEGARLTSPIAGWLGEWSHTIVEHHERYDGGGYPYGIAGRRISPGGRIVAVADSYDVMTSVRSYKRPMSPEKARQELAACAGSQFDPDVVRAFLAVSVWRLRLVAPFSWLGSLTGAKFASAAARLSAVTSHSVVAGVAAAGVLGLTAATPLVSPAAATPPAISGAVAPVRGQSSAAPEPAVHGGDGTTTTTTASDGSKKGDGTTTTVVKSATGSDSKSTTTTTPVRVTTTTTKPGNGGGGTGGGGTKSTTTTTTSTTTTTTTTTLPLPGPPTGLIATGECQLLILGPEVVLTWTASPGPGVTSYDVLRKNGSGGFKEVANVSASTTTYADTSAGGLGSKYTYEIQANSPGGSSISSGAVGTTPALCL
ncbi:MAG: HD domain-containing phosphohydrolase [Acidimicrobiales bacterium]